MECALNGKADTNNSVRNITTTNSGNIRCPHIANGCRLNNNASDNGSSPSFYLPSAEIADFAKTAASAGKTSRIRVLQSTSQLRELHTLLRDRETSRSDFVFYADRLIRLVVEEALNCLPYEEKTVTTPGGHLYEGLRYTRGNCGVSIMRSGEAMEKGLRDCCRAIRIGKVLIQQSEDERQQPEPIYVKLPPGIQERRVLLMYPVLGDGRVVAKALQLLVEEYSIPETNIFLINIFSTRCGVDEVLSAFPEVTVLTSEMHDLVPYHFCAKYFGTD